jgi:hypothetical protein
MMADVLDKNTGKIYRSVNTPDYVGDNYIINPTDFEINAYKVDNTPSEADIAYRELINTDMDISRVVEDLYDALPAEIKSNVAQDTRDKIIDKKDKRAIYLALKGA